MDWVKFGEQVKEKREGKGLSQKDIARLLDVSVAFICQLEKGKKKTSADNLFKLCKVLGIKLVG